MTSLKDHAEEIAQLRERVSALERTVVAFSAPPVPRTTAGPAVLLDAMETYWALNVLKSQNPEPGAVLYTGNVTLPGQGVAEWQHSLSTDDLLARNWSRPTASAALASLGHPVRLRLLQAIARGTVAVSELAALEGVGTTGQVYHHINQLIAAGWVYSRSRGHYGIVPERVVPLLVVVLAAGGI
ncbi:ArsR/SmtB family transcription factor [Arthrobacter antibioticus]|uniref:ArsR/SmtB family transcription factor n=1 Tax=Arthrobacter sp. H35-MC1 TaxID=3046203 RepID=UPI0024BBD749|nr:winged helix-turn-helix domain-containing protein [Arthrobacter sp. H35-MC1]MDJ0315804.1 winged helix-turn-helix domain-containing protein [Arthrobacter sp. H35-MC1]